VRQLSCFNDIISSSNYFIRASIDKIISDLAYISLNSGFLFDDEEELFKIITS